MVLVRITRRLHRYQECRNLLTPPRENSFYSSPRSLLNLVGRGHRDVGETCFFWILPWSLYEEVPDAQRGVEEGRAPMISHEVDS